MHELHMRFICDIGIKLNKHGSSKIVLQYKLCEVFIHEICIDKNNDIKSNTAIPTVHFTFTNDAKFQFAN